MSEHVARTVWYKLHDGHSIFWSAAKSDGFPDVLTTPGHDRHYGSQQEASFQSVLYDWILSRTNREARLYPADFGFSHAVSTSCTRKPETAEKADAEKFSFSVSSAANNVCVCSPACTLDQNRLTGFDP